MEIAKGKIGNALTSTAKNHVVAVANDLYDEDLNKYQSELNNMIGKTDCMYDNELGMYQSELNKQFIEGGGKADYFDGGIIDISKKL